MQKSQGELKYLKGFGNTFATEALQGAVPTNQNSPLKLKYGLFAEQLSGTAFTVKRADNQRTWYYKLRPSVTEGQYLKSEYPFKIIANYYEKEHLEVTPNVLRWKPIPSVKQGSVNFVEGLVSLLGAGDPSLKQGISIYAYSANSSMGKSSFHNSDGDFLIVPHSGTLHVKTLNGKLTVKPKEILVIPRGISFSIDVQGEIKGWVAQIFGNHLALPDLGTIGSNGLANASDFQYPTAWFEDKKQEWKIYNKYIGQMYECSSSFSPYNVVGWKGNYSPYKYNLQLYNAVGTITYDHPDPSIYTVLTNKSAFDGTAVLDFVIFAPRWLVAEHTFQPPFYHKNCMTQFMGNICGSYDAKVSFAPGCSSLHSTMTPHGPDSQTYIKTISSENKPLRIQDNNFSFMFESCYELKTTKFAFEGFAQLDKQYFKCWDKLSELREETK